MGRPKLNEEDKKIKLSITISKDLVVKLNDVTKNKSNFIESLLKKYI